MPEIQISDFQETQDRVPTSAKGTRAQRVQWFILFELTIDAIKKGSDDSIAALAMLLPSIPASLWLANMFSSGMLARVKIPPTRFGLANVVACRRHFAGIQL